MHKRSAFDGSEIGCGNPTNHILVADMAKHLSSCGVESISDLDRSVSNRCDSTHNVQIVRRIAPRSWRAPREVERLATTEEATGVRHPGNPRCCDNGAIIVRALEQTGLR